MANLGKLYIVATPIGNLEDISSRLTRILNEVSLILCEDSRVSIKLLNHLGIKKPTLSYHQHSPVSRTREILARLQEGEDLALVTDAGTPGISDPGNRLINELLAREPELVVVPVPGPCAAITALSVSGFPTDCFLFLGFVPHKNGRHKFLHSVAESERTVVFYESGHRIKKTLAQLGEIVGEERKICLAREITKKFETIYRGSTVHLLELVDDRGEFTVVVSPKNN